VDPQTLTLRNNAGDLLKQLFKQLDSNDIYFGFQNNTYKYLSKNSDGTIKALDLTTGQIVNSVDPISVVSTNGSSAASSLSSSSAAPGSSNFLQLLQGGASSALSVGSLLKGNKAPAATPGSSPIANGGIPPPPPGAPGTGPSFYGQSGTGSPVSGSNPYNFQNHDIQHLIQDLSQPGSQSSTPVPGTTNPYAYPTGAPGNTGPVINHMFDGSSYIDSGITAPTNGGIPYKQGVGYWGYVSNADGTKQNVLSFDTPKGSIQVVVDPSMSGKDAVQSIQLIQDPHLGGETQYYLNYRGESTQVVLGTTIHVPSYGTPWGEIGNNVSDVVPYLPEPGLNLPLILPNVTPPPITPVTDKFGNPAYKLTDPSQYLSKDTISPNDADYKYAQSLLSQGNSTPSVDKIKETVLNWRGGALANETFTQSDMDTFRQQEEHYYESMGLPPPTDDQVQSDFNSYFSNTQINGIKNSAQIQLDKNTAANDKAAAGQLRTEEYKALGGLVGEATAGYGLFESIFSMVTNGVSAKGILGGIGSLVGIGVAAKIAHSAFVLADGTATALLTKLNNLPILGSLHLGSVLKGLTSNWGSVGIMAAITLLGIFFGKKQLSEEEQGAQDMLDAITPTVWNDGPVVMLTAGTALAALGINLSPTTAYLPPQLLTQPQPVLMAALQKDAGGATMPGSDQIYGSVFVSAAKGQATRVMYLTPTGQYNSTGQSIDTLHVLTLNSQYTFGATSPTGPPTAPTSYIPFFLGAGSPNPKAVDAMDSQNASGKCAISGNVSVMTADACAAQGGTFTHL
jgi:hypothetical protein